MRPTARTGQPRAPARARDRRGARAPALAPADAVAQVSLRRLLPVEGLRRARAEPLVGRQEPRRGQGVHAPCARVLPRDRGVHREPAVRADRALYHHGPRGQRPRHRPPRRRPGGRAAAGSLRDALPGGEQAPFLVGRGGGPQDVRRLARLLVQRPGRSRRRRRSVLPILHPRGRRVPARVPREPARGRAGARVSEKPLRQDAVIDAPALVGARWWQDSVVDPVGRRAVILGVLAAGGVLLTGGIVVEACRANATEDKRQGALALQRQYGWSFGAATEDLVFNGVSTEPFDRARLAQMTAEMAPRSAAHKRFYVQTLFESPTA